MIAAADMTDNSLSSAWFGQHIFGASGVETFIAIWSPWFGQVNSVLLVAPYVPDLTDSELAAVMATGTFQRPFPSIAGH